MSSNFKTHNKQIDPSNRLDLECFSSIICCYHHYLYTTKIAEPLFICIPLEVPKRRVRRLNT